MESEAEEEIRDFEENLEEEELESEQISEITTVTEGPEIDISEPDEGFIEDEVIFVSDDVGEKSTSDYSSIDFNQFTYTEEIKQEHRVEYDDESISNESDLLEWKLHPSKPRNKPHAIDKENAKKAVKAYKQELRDAIKREYEIRLGKAKEERTCYNFLRTCSRRCYIPTIQDWKRYLIKEKDVVEQRIRTIPIKVHAEEIEFMKIRQGQFAKIIFAKRVIEDEFFDDEESDDDNKLKYIEVYKKYYMIKAYSKVNAVKWNIVRFIKNEKDILISVNFPFISHTEFFYQDQDYLYLGFPFIAGKSLRYYLMKEARLPEPIIKFYAAQIILAIEYLQFSNIIYRNLKPENVIVEPTGYIKLIGFMKAKIVRDRTFTRCIDLEYAPPELFTEGEYGKPADWWALAVNIFELGTGFTPFESGNQKDTIERITKGIFKKPGHFSIELRHLLQQMLAIPFGVRAGTTIDLLDEVKIHVWFDNIKWDALVNQEVPAPLIPGIHNPLKEYQFVEYSEGYLNEYFYEEVSDAEDYEEFFHSF